MEAGAVGRRRDGLLPPDPGLGGGTAAGGRGRRPRRSVDDAADFTGTDIAVYFRSEVLDAQPARVRDFLLSTSVVDVLYPDLAVALSGSRDAAPTLRELAQASVFLDPAPGATEAYAYHPLVRDLLRAQLRLESPSKVRRLHRKAARWLADPDGRPRRSSSPPPPTTRRPRPSCSSRIVRWAGC